MHLLSERVDCAKLAVVPFEEAVSVCVTPLYKGDKFLACQVVVLFFFFLIGKLFC